MALPQVERGGTDTERTLQYIMDTFHLLKPDSGRMWYVDGVNGDDYNPGTSPTAPKLTIKAMLDECTADGYDIINILDYPVGAVSGEDQPIVMDTWGVTLRGIGWTRNKPVEFFPSGDTDMFLVTNHNVRFENIYLSGGASEAGIEVTATVWGLTVVGCNFGLAHTATYGIHSAGGSALPYLHIKDCQFGRRGGVNNFTDAIKLEGNSTHGKVEDCIFEGYTGIGISLPAVLGPGFQVFNNKFYMPSDADGSAITLADGSSGNAIDGNRAYFGTADPTDPYRDLNGDDDSNAWGLNHKGITATLPKLT